jgi:hypothetical protein
MSLIVIHSNMTDAKVEARMAILRIVSAYEDKDCVLFDPVTISRSTSAPIHSSPTLPRRVADRRLKTPAISPHPSKPLPSLPEDGEIRDLRAHVNDLGHQVLDLETEIKSRLQTISDLKRQLRSLGDLGTGRLMYSPRRAIKGLAPTAAPPNPPKPQTPDELVAFYRQKYEDEKKKYDGLMQVRTFF